MINMALNSRYTLAIENDNKVLRLIVLNNDAEWVCRKTTLKQLAAFVESNDATLFNGRLHLSKHKSGIMISVKGENIGLVSARQLLESANLAVVTA